MADNVIAIYLRLSCEDTDINSKDESNSITNQRNLIMEYIKSDAVLSTYTVREYIDDGISGTRFDREAFEEMMTQVKEGNIQVIITKITAVWVEIIWKLEDIWSLYFRCLK